MKKIAPWSLLIAAVFAVMGLPYYPRMPVLAVAAYVFMAVLMAVWCGYIIGLAPLMRPDPLPRKTSGPSAGFTGGGN